MFQVVNSIIKKVGTNGHGFHGNDSTKGSDRLLSRLHATNKVKMQQSLYIICFYHSMQSENFNVPYLAF